MARKDNLIKSKSLYSVRKKHKTTSYGVIYENDIFTITPNNELFSDDITLYSDSNFKYRISSSKNSKKRHYRGDFLKPEQQISGCSEYVWTLENVGDGKITSETRIEQKPNYSSLSDFAYYGSAVELVKSTVKDVAMRYPGGISYYDNAPTYKIDGTTYYVVANEYDIDCWTSVSSIAENALENPMRVLAASFMNYELCDEIYSGATCSSPVFSANGQTCANTIIGTVNFGAGIFYVYKEQDGRNTLLTTRNGVGCIIKPKKKFIDNFWNSIDDFAKVLLNRDTYPIYKSVFERVEMDEENGYYYTNESYIWPTVSTHDLSPSISSDAFQSYIASLLSLAMYHDGINSDNIWRMMTHESIKNLDWTYNNEDFNDADTSGMAAMIRLYGRLFDDIKRYADGIKSMNVLSYDEKNNVPDYFLSDKVEEDGWIAKHVAPFENILTEEVIIETLSGRTTVYPKDKNTAYVNSAFQRRLALSSNYIQSMKGTRRGIESILGMFGYTQDNNISSAGTFKIDEYVFLVTSGISYYEASAVRGCFENNSETDEFVTNALHDFPIAVIPYNNGEEEDRYIVPWFDKNKWYRYPFYFQNKGGWGKCKSKNINLPLTSATTITSNGNIQIYGETQPYMKFVDTINDMLYISNYELFENVICYVTDISDIDSRYNKRNGEDDNFSHYFSLKNTNLSMRCGFVSNDLYECYGWKNIHIDEIENCSSDDGLMVLYLESMTANYNGNNPHIGFGRYDDGESYIENFTNLFKGYVDDGKLNDTMVQLSFQGEHFIDSYEEVVNGEYGFKYLNGGGEIIDNKKCAYYHDYVFNGSPWYGVGESAQTNTWNSSQYTSVNFPDTPSIVNGVADESQANAVINLKKIVVTFNTGNNIYLKNYIKNVVLTYLEEMIPSSTILEYRFDNEGEIGYIVSEINNTNNGTYSYMGAAHVLLSGETESVIWQGISDPL